MGGLLLLASATGATLYFRFPRHPDWRALARAISAHGSPDEPVVMLPAHRLEHISLSYYLGEEVLVLDPGGGGLPQLGSAPGVWLAAGRWRLSDLSEPVAGPVARLEDRYRHREDHPVPRALAVHYWGSLR